MKSRKRMSRGKSRRNFKASTGSKSVNSGRRPMRGGWRF